MLALIFLLGVLQDAGSHAEAVRVAIVGTCAIPAERLAIEHDPAMAMPGLLIKGNAPLTDAQLRCYGDELAAAGEVYPAIEDEDLSARYSRVAERDSRATARAAMRRRGLLAKLPRFDPRRETLPRFARRLEALCHVKLGSILQVHDKHIRLVETALATDAPFSEVEFCAIDAAIASGHNPFYLPPVEVIPTPVPVSDVILPKND